MTATTINRPSHSVYVVRGDGEHARWTRIGAAWPNKDNLGFSLALDAAPIGGRVVIRPVKIREGAQQ